MTRSQDYDRKQMRVNYEGQARDRFRVGGSALLVRSLQRLGRGDGLYDEAIKDYAAQRALRQRGQHRLQADAGRPARQPAVRREQLARRHAFATASSGRCSRASTCSRVSTYRVNFGPDMTFERNGHVHRRADAGQPGRGEPGRESANRRTFDYTLDNLLTYKRELGTDPQGRRHAALLDREADVRGALGARPELAVRDARGTTTSAAPPPWSASAA